MQNHQDNQAPNEESFCSQNQNQNQNQNLPINEFINQIRPIPFINFHLFQYLQYLNQIQQWIEMSNTKTIPTTHTLQATQSHLDNQAASSIKPISSFSHSDLQSNLPVKTTNTYELTSKDYSGYQIRETFDSSLTENKTEKKINDKQSLTCNSLSYIKNFNDPSHLNDHKPEYIGKKSFSCHICLKQFSCKSSLKRHINVIHKNIRPYLCTLPNCGKSYGSYANLTSHIRIHTGERPYLCNKCGKSFRHFQSLIYHNHTHTAKNPYLCNKCGKSFESSAYLTCYILTHTGEKQYVCDICQRRFELKSNFEGHIKIHDKNNEKR